MARQYDVILFGATGFTGGLVAEYLAGVGKQESFRWALAGRNTAKLESVRARVQAINPQAVPELLQADVNDISSIAALAASTTSIITTVGPYALYGEPLVRACAGAGTHYVDLTGEPQFVAAMRERYDDIARKTGAKIVSSCGFESIPPDIGNLFAVNTLRERLGAQAFAEASVVVHGGVEAGGDFSGGTWHSAIEAMATARDWWAKRPRLPKDNVHALPLRFYKDKHLDRWGMPLPTIDPEVVRHSARVRGDYGREFSYGHYYLGKNLLPMLGGAAGIGAIFTLAQFAPTKKMLLSVRAPGEGPSAEKRAKGWFRMSFVAEGAGQSVVCTVSGGDPGYGDTAKMLAEAGLCLALDGDKLPQAAGVITPASAMGEVLVPRLERAGIRFAVAG